MRSVTRSASASARSRSSSEVGPRVTWDDRSRGSPPTPSPWEVRKEARVAGSSSLCDRRLPHCVLVSFHPRPHAVLACKIAPTMSLMYSEGTALGRAPMRLDLLTLLQVNPKPKWLRSNRKARKPKDPADQCPLRTCFLTGWSHPHHLHTGSYSEPFSFAQQKRRGVNVDFP